MPTKSSMRRGRTSVAGTKKKRTYKTVSCHDKKSTATSKAKTLRAKGMTARVVKTAGKGYCVKSAGKRKKA